MKIFNKIVLFVLIFTIFLSIIALIVLVILQSNENEDIASLKTKNISEQKIYTIEQIENIYYQTPNKTAMSYFYSLSDIEKYQTVDFIKKSPVICFEAKSFIYYTYYQLEDSKLFILFDKTGRELYSFILNKNPPNEAQFKEISTGQSLQDVKNIDTNTYIFKKYPPVASLSNADVLIKQPYSIHITTTAKLVKVDYSNSNGDFVVSNISFDEYDLKENSINKFISYALRRLM